MSSLLIYCHSILVLELCLLPSSEGSTRSSFAFTSVVREYLHPLVKADRCAQYVDDIGIEVNTLEELKVGKS